MKDNNKKIYDISFFIWFAQDTKKYEDDNVKNAADIYGYYQEPILSDEGDCWWYTSIKDVEHCSDYRKYDYMATDIDEDSEDGFNQLFLDVFKLEKDCNDIQKRKIYLVQNDNPKHTYICRDGSEVWLENEELEIKIRLERFSSASLDEGNIIIESPFKELWEDLYYDVFVGYC